MSKNYSRGELWHIAERLADELWKCEDGARVTTWQLLAVKGYDMGDFDWRDLLDVHQGLIRAAKANGIMLHEPDAENGGVDPLYTREITVWPKTKCPYCGSKNTADILYGCTAFSENLGKRIRAGKIVLRSNRVASVPVNGKMVQTDAKKVCNDCKRTFGTPPLIIAEDRSFAEDYRDIVTSMEFYVGGFYQGYSETIFTKSDEGVFIKKKSYGGVRDISESVEKSTIERWNIIVDTLYSAIYLHEWEKKFDDHARDGEQWGLTIKMTDGREIEYYGNNVYPPYWKELCLILDEFTATGILGDLYDSVMGFMDFYEKFNRWNLEKTDFYERI